MPDSDTKSFILKERGSLPRILLLDFDDEYALQLEELGYDVTLGYSGLGDVIWHFPKHPSEVEIILWDTSRVRVDSKITTASGAEFLSDRFVGIKIYNEVLSTLKQYFERVRDKGGFVGIFLGDNLPQQLRELSDLLGHNFDFKSRDTSTLYLNKEEDDVWYEFYKRFIQEENIFFSIQWNGNLLNFINYFEDEDDNTHAVSYDYFAIIPKIEEVRKQEALTYLLQDVLPHYCSGKDIFPDKYYHRWTNKELYLPTRVQGLREEKIVLSQKYEEEIQMRDDEILMEIANNEYLSNMLVADDSDLFDDDKKLSTCVHKILEDDIGFIVTNVDEMRLSVGESLKEDKWIEDSDGYFALVEIKGTERGAKANWVRQDLNAHIREFEVIKNITGLKSILVFNHERRTEPAERSVPFSGDTDLVIYCEKSNICLVSVYELFKIARDIKEGLLSSEEARSIIKISKGMLSYKNKEVNSLSI